MPTGLTCMTLFYSTHPTKYMQRHQDNVYISNIDSTYYMAEYGIFVDSAASLEMYPCIHPPTSHPPTHPPIHLPIHRPYLPTYLLPTYIRTQLHNYSVGCIVQLVNIAELLNEAS